ncbi:hypothetical protein FLONG3_3550 [Fusarium longipes]|uniref:Monocarboxylate transporter 4 n=1 Tax=Fusarium longipes TaxID=694270 RepID=A0A395T0Y2_9HYPO|nr:hypothetical protein FLONG3_3550 [Fusarium longipes]
MMSKQTNSNTRQAGAKASSSVVLSAHFVVMNTSGFLNSFGALQSHFIETFNEPASTVSWIGSMQIFLYFFVGIFSGRLTDVGYYRSTFLTGSVAIVVAIFASSFGSKLWIMFLTLGLTVGLGNGLISCPMVTVTSSYFSERRGLAISIAMCGSCTGGLVYSGIMRQLIPQLGFAWTMRVIALIQLVTLGFANICLRPRTEGKKSRDWVDWSAFRDARFNNYAAATFMSLLGLYISIFYIVDFSRTSISPPFSYQDSLNLLLISNGVNVIGRLGSGFLADKIGILVIFVPVLASTAAILFSWIAVETAPGMYVWTIFVGILSGGIQSLFPAGLGYLTAGTKKPGTRMGMVFGLSRNCTDLDDTLNPPADPEPADLSALWNIVNDTIDPQQLSTDLTHGEVDRNKFIETGNFSQAPGTSNQLSIVDQKPSQKPGKRLSLVSVRVLNRWLSTHTHHPYPTVAEVESIIRQTGLSKQQILNWFANARRRKKFERPDMTDYSSGSAEASPRDIPLQRPPTPFVQQSPFERWRNSPPEDEPSNMAAIAKAVSGASEYLTEYSHVQPGHAPSVTGSWATSAETSDSSQNSRTSAYSHRSDGSIGSLRKVNKRRRRPGLRGRRQNTRQLSQACHRFQCTFCTETFKLKHTWSRHERTQHLSLEQWECTPLGPTALNEQSETVCVYCGIVSPNVAHFESHNHDLCRKRERNERTFHRKDHLRQHLRLVHGSEFRKWPMEEWRSKHEEILSRCGFCDINMTTWSDRANHLAEHFKEGMTMADWKGNWGFDEFVLEMVENSMPPYLIDYERNSPLPFTTSQGAPYSSTSAFELLQLELDYFYSNYLDATYTIPSQETLHIEACCIVYGAEMSSSSTSQTASSWLRDLIMGTEHITTKARMKPMKSAARARLTELRIHSKSNIFEHCNLESSLKQYVDMLKLLNLEIGDDELQKEACSIISHQSDASPMFTDLLMTLISGSTQWLVPFRLRAGLPVEEDTLPVVGNVESEEYLLEPDFLANLEISHQTVPDDINTMRPLSPSPFSSQKVVSLNDGNMYRGFTRDLTRWVARTISPLNPTSHVPTDEEIQYQARWIEYDSHDVWNQTPADNMAWLEEFKKESGLFE